MQHLDEGTIHGWLDGALTADEAARVEAHVNECPRCAERVAEARGLIAASSRILTALDSVPNRVLPQKRVTSRNWVPWRAAAAIAVVLAGTLVVTRERTAQRDSFATTQESVANPEPRLASPVTGLAKPSGATGASTPRSTGTPRSTERSSDRAAAGGSVRAGVTGRVMEQKTPTSANAHGDEAAKPAASGAVAGVVAGGEPFAAARPTAVALDAVVPRITPRVVGNPSVVGEKRTLYEVAPGDTVLLAESESVASNMVVTGTATTAPPRAQRTAKAPAPVQTHDAPMSSASGSNGVNTIVWTDAATGKLMKLSGHHSRAELEDIRRRIEQARAAESTKAKAP